MNRYPLWKNLLVIVVVAVALLYAAPNIFGETPAVQVQPLKPGIKVDGSLMTRVEDILKKSGVEVRGAVLDPTSVKVKFKDPDTQQRAKTALQNEMGGDYVVALNLISNSPRWMTSINALPMYLGLDLRGGVHFLMQVDLNGPQGAITKASQRNVNNIKQALRDKEIRYSFVNPEGQIVVVGLRDEALRDKALQVIERELGDYVWTKQTRGNDQVLVSAWKPEALNRIKEFAVQQNIGTLRKRVNELGVAEPIVQQSGEERIVVQLPGIQDTAEAKRILGRTATLEVRMVDEEHSDQGSIEAAKTGSTPFGSELLYERGGMPVMLKKQVALSGESIADAQPGFDGQTGEPAVHLNLDSAGAKIFQTLTRENVGKRMAMVLIERNQGEVVTAPVIRTEIAGGRVQISGRMNTQEAREIALLLRAGALAAPMDIVEERTVGPSLGAQNIAKGWKSTMIGFGLIAVFMIIYYVIFGVVSVIALAINLILLVALLSMLQATLTLPGIAAIALTLGMAIDANVLINERIREELRNGTTPQAAITQGYERAWATILDSNITTLIAGVMLFLLGSGPVRGFAVVHCLGIMTSMFSAVVVSRSIVNFLYGSRRKLDKLAIGNTDWHKRAAPSAA